MNEPTTDQWYMAQIASEIACTPFRVWGKDAPAELKQPKSFILKFDTAEKTSERQKEVDEQRELAEAELRKQVSTSVWLSAFGFDENLNYIGPIGKDKKQGPDGMPLQFDAAGRQVPIDSSGSPPVQSGKPDAAPVQSQPRPPRPPKPPNRTRGGVRTFSASDVAKE